MLKEIKNNDIVIISIKSITNYGATAEIIGYPEYEGFLHVSEIVSKWVKNISDYIKVGMKTAALVLEVDKNKKVVSLSLKRLSEEQKRKAMEEYENNKRALKILEETIKKSREKITLEQAQELIMEEYENLHDFMLDVFDEGSIVAKELGFSEGFSNILEEYVKKVYKKKELTIKFLLKFEIYEWDGVKTIKKHLADVERIAKIHYISAGNYMIIVKAEDYKEAKQKIKKIKELLDPLEKISSNFTMEETD